MLNKNKIFSFNFKNSIMQKFYSLSIFNNLYFARGRYATVKKCYCKKTRKCYAAKIIKNFRTKNTKMNLNIVENEVTALTLARSHSSIVTLYEVFHHKGETILILE